MLDVPIDEFWNDCAAILLTGIRSFPRPQTLLMEDICRPDSADDLGLPRARHLAAVGAGQWLQDGGFIRFSTLSPQESVDDFVLTGKPFRRLLTIANPDSLKRGGGQLQQADSTPVFQVLEFARLQGNSGWCGELLQHYLLQP